MQKSGLLKGILGAVCGLAVSVMAFTPAYAKSCYSAAEYQAEQAIRFHNELMVIGLSCQRLSPEKMLYSSYKSFTNKHRSALMQWEKALMKSMGGQASFDAFRTRIANQSSQQAAQMGIENFCQKNMGMMMEALALSNGEIPAFIARNPMLQTASLPSCGGEAPEIESAQALNKE